MARNVSLQGLSEISLAAHAVSCVGTQTRCFIIFSHSVNRTQQAQVIIDGLCVFLSLLSRHQFLRFVHNGLTGRCLTRPEHRGRMRPVFPLAPSLGFPCLLWPGRTRRRRRRRVRRIGQSGARFPDSPRCECAPWSRLHQWRRWRSTSCARCRTRRGPAPRPARPSRIQLQKSLTANRRQLLGRQRSRPRRIMLWLRHR